MSRSAFPTRRTLHRLAEGRSRRLLVCRVVLLSAAWAGLAGCGGSSSLTGGSIPPGAVAGVSAGRVTGRVAGAQAPEQGLAGVMVRAVLSDGTTETALTDAQGAFVLGNVPPGELRLRLVPAPRHAVRGRDFSVMLGPTQEVVLGVVLESEQAPAMSSEFDQALGITPVSVTLRVGETVGFAVSFPPGSGGLFPVWIVEGGFGAISPTGRFEAREPGYGRVVARLGHRDAVAEVTVIPAS